MTKDANTQGTELTRRIVSRMLYVMNTKLTLRVDDALVDRAKAEAERRGKSVSQMVSEFFDSLAKEHRKSTNTPPITTSLVGVLKGRKITESTYKKHLRDKYL